MKSKYKFHIVVMTYEEYYYEVLMSQSPGATLTFIDICMPIYVVYIYDLYIYF